MIAPGAELRSARPDIHIWACGPHIPSSTLVSMKSPRDGAPENPFDDPEFRDMMESMGIVHTPGLAQEVLGELAPLLASEGVDLNAPEGMEGLSEEDLNAAMNSAVERYNMELHTPTGEDRLAALEVLNSCAEAIGRGDSGLAGLIMEILRPEGYGAWPAVSHVIGVGLGQLDEWGRRSDLRKALTSAKLPHWEWRGTKAAKDALRAARKSAAFDEIDRLTVTYNGLGLLHGTMLAYAGVVGGAARMWKTDVPGALSKLDVPRSAAVREAVEWLEKDHGLAEEVEEWFVATYTALAKEDPAAQDPDAPPLDLADLGENLTLVEDTVEAFTGARSQGIDPLTPDGISELLDVIHDMAIDAQEEDDRQASDYLLKYAHSMLETLTSYIFFRIESGEDVDEWSAVFEHAEVVRHIVKSGGGFDPEMLESLPIADDGERHAALTSLSIVAALPEIIAWAGSEPKGTSTGSLRRADIQPVAKMLGLEVVGQAKVPNPWEQDPEDQTRYVHSMAEAKELAAWIAVLEMMGIVIFDRSRFRLGEEAARWEHPETVDTEDLEAFVGTFLVFSMVGVSESDNSVGRRLYRANEMQILSEVLDLKPVLAVFTHPASYGSIFGRRSSIDNLEDLGFLTQNPADLENDPRRVRPYMGKKLGAIGPEEIEIPVALQRTVAKAVLVTLDYLQG